MEKEFRMSYEKYSVVDCDGHIVESIPEFAEFMSERIRGHALKPSRNRQGVFPSLDGMHFALHEGKSTAKKRVTASEYRPGSGEDWLAFLDRAKIERTVLFTSEGLSVGFIQIPRYAVEVCRAYNDYVYDKYAKLSDRLRPMALIPMQDVPAAVRELGRAVGELGLPGAMLPSTGLPLHLGHETYWPIYAEAEKLGCALAVHGGANLEGAGLNTFTNFTASHILHHPVALMVAMVSLIYHGVLDRFPNLRVAFMEGGCGWLASILDRAERDENYFDSQDQPGSKAIEYLNSGRILIGCEGSEGALAYLARRVGISPFAYASDYPHEVDLPAARHEIEEIAERADLTEKEKQAVLADNARRFFRL
ncbi:MAG: amidohydrolase family protein [Candidatus Binatota bacterium]